MSRVLVVGGGAAGMMAALAAAGKGHRVTLFEKNEKLGKKIYITGKGRCNVTNACEPQELFDNVVSNSKFCTALSMVLIIMPCSSFLKPMAVP